LHGIKIHFREFLYNLCAKRDKLLVWLASSEEVPGLALEAGSLDALMERVKYAVPDLLDLKDGDIKINFKAERLAEVHVQ
jgi:hypothetical protein